MKFVTVNVTETVDLHRDDKQIKAKRSFGKDCVGFLVFNGGMALSELILVFFERAC